MDLSGYAGGGGWRCSAVAKPVELYSSATRSGLVLFQLTPSAHLLLYRAFRAGGGAAEFELRPASAPWVNGQLVEDFIRQLQYGEAQAGERGALQGMNKIVVRLEDLVSGTRLLFPARGSKTQNSHPVDRRGGWGRGGPVEGMLKDMPWTGRSIWAGR